MPRPEPITVGKGIQRSDWPGVGSTPDPAAGVGPSFRNTWAMVVQSETGHRRRARMVGRKTIMEIQKSKQEKEGS